LGMDESKPEPIEEDCIQSDLLARGWTKRIIDRLLVSPDEILHRRGGGTINIYRAARVNAAEQSDEFARLLAEAAPRKAAAAKAVDTKMQNMVEHIKTAKLEIIPNKTDSEIHDLAYLTHGGRYQGKLGEFRWSNHVARNCIRHNLTNYEELWDLINRGYTGQKAYDILRKRIDALVDKTYPRYADATFVTKEFCMSNAVYRTD